MTERRRRLMGRGLGLLLIALGVAQLALIVALVQPIDWGWQVLGILGTIFWVGLFVSIGVVVATSEVLLGSVVGVSTLIAALAVLAGAASWASLLGGPLLLDADEAPRIWAIIIADGCFAVWAIVLAFDSKAPDAPGIPFLASLLAFRTIVEWFYFLPILVPTSPSVEQPAGASSGGTVLLFGAVFLGGYILVAIWELVLGLSRLKIRLSPQGFS